MSWRKGEINGWVYFKATEIEVLQKTRAVWCSNDTWRYFPKYFCCVSALGFPIKTLRTYRFSSILATCLTHRIQP
jgi:hypothetical protein